MEDYIDLVGQYARSEISWEQFAQQCSDVSDELKKPHC